MVRGIKRKQITDPYLKVIVDTEAHHDHEIVIDNRGVFRWKANEEVEKMIETLNPYDVFELLEKMGFGLNSEVYRKLARDMGFTLFAYYEKFYNENNNPDVAAYRLQHS